MKKFVIETNLNYIEVMKKILSDCDVSGHLQPEIKTFLDESKSERKIYNCYVSNNKLSINMKMPYRNSFASTMNLEILIFENKTRINGSIASLMDSKIFQKTLSFFILIGSFVFLLIQTVRFSKEAFQLSDWVSVAVAFVTFLSVLPFAFKSGKEKETQPDLTDSYGIQMENWISNLFPGEYKTLEK